MMRSILLTGFEPFNGSTLNPSQRIVESLNDGGHELGIELQTALLPVDSARVAGVLLPLLDRVRPGAVIHVGESAKADRVMLERLAVNLLDFDCADNAGALVCDAAIEPGGPAARWGTWDVRAVASAIEATGLSCGLSMSAGTYLCNQVYFLTLGWAERQAAAGVTCRIGFMHVPSMLEQVASGERCGPGQAWELSRAAVVAAVRAVAGVG